MPTNLPTAPVTLLDAVNRCMLAIGQSPLNDLDNDASVYKDTALNQLNEEDKILQSEGWTWNKEIDLPLLPDADGIILVPDGTLRVTRAHWQGDPGLFIVQRGQRLYNRKDHTYTFTVSEVLVDAIVRQQWENMPEIARLVVTLRAAKSVQGNIQTDAMVDRITDDSISLALAALEQAEDEVEQTNNITGNQQILGALHGVGRGSGGPIRRR